MMADQVPSAEIIPEDQPLWQTDRQPAGCSHCRRTYLVPPELRGTACPLCRRGALEAQPVYMRRADPERLLPFRITKPDLLPIYHRFTSGVWIRPEGFNPETLLKNTRPVFFPLWLVDSDVSGNWQMEAGFDYQVESTREVYASGGWESRKKIENRVRWEPRVGELSTRVDNVPTPALEEHTNRQQMAGSFQLARGVDFDPGLLGSAYLELPDVPPDNAWPLARPDFDKALAGISQQAAGAQHYRNFTMQAMFANQNWTEFFLPMYVTHYTDDDGKPQIVVVNGESGAITGPRLASRKRGGQIAGIVGGIAGVLFLLALIGLLLTVVFPPAVLIGGLVGTLGLGAGIVALIAAIWPGQWNRNQTGPRMAEKEK